MEEKKELLDQDERVVEIELERLRGFVNHAFVITRFVIKKVPSGLAITPRTVRWYSPSFKHQSLRFIIRPVNSY